MKLFITTSGIGSRLLDLTKYTNKSMIKIGKKPVISYIIDEYPEDTELVISLGYYGDHVKQYLDLAYPNRKITYVWVDNYDGPGSSQVYSQLQAEQYLQEPFIYHDCDTIVENLQDQIPMDFDYNFLVGYETNSELYDAFDYDVNNKTKDKFESYKLIKTYMKPDSLVGMLSFIGICGIYDYKTFWENMHKAYEDERFKTPYDFLVYHEYQMFDDLRAIKVNNWTDTGNIAGVKEARKKCKDNFFILDKIDQGIFIIKDKVIKFFAKDGVVDNLITHYNKINQFCQPITNYTKNFLCYDFIDADNAINNMNPVRFEKMLNYFKDNGLWEIQNVDNNLFNKCKDKFYINKTLDRVNQFKEFYNINEDKDIYINDVLIPKEYTIEYMISEFTKSKYYKETKCTGWHGDFVLDNMLWDGNKFILLDWREKFDNIIEYGDMNYDFGKMNHNLTFNFSSACNDLFTIKEYEDNVYVSILADNYVYECRNILKRFVETNYNISYDYINFITAICWISMTPLYFLNPLCKLLFYMGKLTMYQSLINMKKEED